MEPTNIKIKVEYDKQYRLKRKLLLQQQASKDIYMIYFFNSRNL
jgi:hypothetical protein